MEQMPKVEIAPAEGKLGILTPGLGAVATTFIAGVESVRRGLAKPIGSVSQMQTLHQQSSTANPFNVTRHSCIASHQGIEHVLVQSQQDRRSARAIGELIRLIGEQRVFAEMLAGISDLKRKLEPLVKRCETYAKKLGERVSRRIRRK